MKLLRCSTLIFTAATLLFASCAKKNEPAKAGQDGAESRPLLTQDNQAKIERGVVCIVDGAVLKQEPQKRGKFIATINLGETVKSLGDSAIDSADRNRLYRKIELSDGKTGWTADYGVILNARLGAILTTATIYMRPDLLTGTDDRLHLMDPIAIVEEKGDWMEFIAQSRKKTGWIKTTTVTFDPSDVAVAVLAFKKLKPEDLRNRTPLVKAFIDSTPYPESFFIAKLKETLPVEQDIDTLIKSEPLPLDSALDSTAELKKALEF